MFYYYTECAVKTAGLFLRHARKGAYRTCSLNVLNIHMCRLTKMDIHAGFRCLGREHYLYLPRMSRPTLRRIDPPSALSFYPPSIVVAKKKTCGQMGELPFVPHQAR